MAAIDVVLLQVNEILARDGRIPRYLEVTPWMFTQLKKEKGAGDVEWIEIHVRGERIDVFARQSRCIGHLGIV